MKGSESARFLFRPGKDMDTGSCRRTSVDMGRNYGKMKGKLWKIMGKLWKNDRKMIGKQ